VSKKEATAKVLAEKAAAAAQTAEAERLAKRRRIFKKAAAYQREYAAQTKNNLRMRRAAKANGNYYAEPQARLAFVIRIRGINQMGPKAKKILQLLRLRQINNGVFMKINKASMNLLRYVEPYVTYGYANMKSVKELVYKRGCLKLDGRRVPITDNSVVDAAGIEGIECVEDIIHEIVTIGPNFKKVNNTLWPFKLSSPKGGFRHKVKGYAEGGDYGNREDAINKLIKQMNGN
jgi:60S ribosomal protein uL30